MSTTTTFDIHADVIAPAKAPAKSSGFFERLINARLHEGRARVAPYLVQQSDETLLGLGFTAAQIADMRSTGRVPASFWR